MFATIQPYHYHQKRQNKTALNPRKRFSYLNEVEDQLPRPSTVNEYFNQKVSLKNYRTIDLAELELSKQFQKEMNPFIKEKIKQLTNKKHKKLFFGRSFSQFGEDPEDTMNYTLKSSLTNSPMNIKQMKICTFLNKDSLHPVKIQKVVDEAMITTTKQRINRLLSMKKEQEQKYTNLKENLRIRCSANDKSYQFKNKSVKNQDEPRLIANEQWDKDWKKQTHKESVRYRNRLINMHKRSVDRKIPFSGVLNIQD